MAENAIKAKVSGKVQGVGFRNFIQDKAAGHHVRGWVQNAGDGTVEAVLAGEALDLEEVVKALREGPSGAEVADVATEPAETSDVLGCKDVEIRG